LNPGKIQRNPHMALLQAQYCHIIYTTGPMAILGATNNVVGTENCMNSLLRQLQNKIVAR